MRQWKSPLLCLAAVLMLVAVGCANPAADAPQAEVSEPAPTPEPAPEPTDDQAALPAGTVYTIGEGSSIGFVGSKVTGSHEGGFEQFEGEITLVDGDITQSRVDVTITTDSLWSDSDGLTGHLKSADFFDTASFPTASFQSTSVEAGDAGYTITGNLDLHGVTKQISFPATITVEGEQVTAAAEFAIKRFDFGIEYAGKADDLIRDDVLIKLNLVASGSAPVV